MKLLLHRSKLLKQSQKLELAQRLVVLLDLLYAGAGSIGWLSIFNFMNLSFNQPQPEKTLRLALNLDLSPRKDAGRVCRDTKHEKTVFSSLLSKL